MTASTGDQLSLDDLEEGRRRRDRGVVIASAATNTAWRVHAERVLAELADSGREFTADDLFARCGHPLGSSPNAVGGLFATAARRGMIRYVGVTQSRRESRAAGLQRVWQGCG